MAFDAVSIHHFLCDALLRSLFIPRGCSGDTPYADVILTFLDSMNEITSLLEYRIDFPILQ